MTSPFAPTAIPLVILESPYAGTVEDNLVYARKSALDCAMLGEATQASHMYYTQFLDDTVPAHRELGIKLGLAWRRVANYSVFYTDRGWSRGMRQALVSAIVEERQFKIRSLFNTPMVPTALIADLGPEGPNRVEEALQRVNRTWTV
jgi:hypothetical protein